jgi:hypothetical protein
MAARKHQGDDLVQGGVALHPHHLQTGHHDLPDQGIFEIKDTFNELSGFPADEAPFLAFIDDVLNFAFEIFRLRDAPAGEPLPEALKQAGGWTLGLFHVQPRICSRS